MRSFSPSYIAKALPWLILASAVLIGILPAISHAQNADILEVDFEATPLFLSANVVPGDGETRTVTVTNNGSESETVYATVENEFDAGLAPVMQLSIDSGSTSYFDASFTSFFNDGEVALGELAPGADRTYSFTADLPTSAGNAYQDKELGFDLVIGFEDGPDVTDTPINRTSSGGSGGGSRFLITNEAATSTGTTGIVTWNTNRNGTTYLVCGLVENGPFTLESASPFGYEYRIPEDTRLTTRHQVTQTDLDPGEYECLPVSRPNARSNFTTGDPIQFTIEGGTPTIAGASTSAPPPLPAVPPGGSVLGVSKGTLGGPTYDEWRAGLDDSRNGSSTNITHDRLSSTTAIASSGERQQGSSTSFIANQLTERPFFWGIIAMLLGLGAILGTRRFARR